MLPFPQIEPQVLFAAQEAVDAEYGSIGLLEAEWIARRLGISGVHHQPARRHQGHQQVLVYRQLVFAPGEEAQPWMEPVGLRRGEEFDALVDEHVRGITPRIAFAGIPAGRDDCSNPLIESGAHQRLLPSAGMACEADLIFSHFRERQEVIYRARGGPAPTRETGKIVFLVDFNVRIGIVAVAVERIGSGVIAADIAALHRRVQPGTPAVVIGQENGEGALALGNDQLHPQGGAMAGPEFEPDVANSRGAFPARPRDHRAQVVRCGRHLSEYPLFELCADELFLAIPQGGVGHRQFAAALEKHERSGRPAIEGMEEKSGGSSPVRFTQSSQTLSRVFMRPLAGGRLGGKIFSKISRSARRRASMPEDAASDCAAEPGVDASTDAPREAAAGVNSALRVISISVRDMTARGECGQSALHCAGQIQ